MHRTVEATADLSVAESISRIQGHDCFPCVEATADLSVAESKPDTNSSFSTYADSFAYNAVGRLVEEVFTATPNCEQGQKGCTIPGPVTTSYVYAGSRLLSTETSAGTTYLTADHLGSPRINTDGSGNVVARHDYMPFGEEIFTALTAQRTSGVGYSGDNVRKQFTGYERDNETDLDYAEARMYANRLGKFTSPDPLLNSGRPNNPKSWNRYTYSLNNPLRFVDPSGLYEYDANATDKQKKRFEEHLKKAKEHLVKIEKKYGKDSDEYKNAARALNSYGAANKVNGIIVAFGKTSTGKAGETSGLIGENGKKTITVTLDIDNIKDDGDLQTIIGHEGSHAQDRSDFVDAYLAAGNDEAKLISVLKGPLNMTSNDTETLAYGVSSVIAQFAMKNEIAPQSSGGNFVLSNREYICKPPLIVTNLNWSFRVSENWFV